FKQTLVPADEGRLPPMFGHVLKRPQRRRVYFYDTADLALSAESGLLLRARVTQGDDDDSTVKVRPAGLEPGAAWRPIDGVEIELDVSGKGPTCSAKLDGSPEHGEIEDVEAGKRAIGGLFSHRRQADLIQAYAPRGVRLDDLAVLGPVDARKWVFEDLPGFPYALCVEEWSLP